MSQSELAGNPPQSSAPVMTRVPVPSLSFEQFRQIIDPNQYRWLEELIVRSNELLAGRVVWAVNATATGGGVAEMLQSLLAYARGSGVDARWLVLRGNPEFFQVTKRIHNHLHGSPGDGGALGPAERDIYESALADNSADLAAAVRPGDIVVLHDPQTAGMAPALVDSGVHVIWRCHVGLDQPHDLARKAWAFLLPDITTAHAYVFSRRAHLWEGLDPAQTLIIPPSIDPLSPKNQDLTPASMRGILGACGLLPGGRGGDSTFVRTDGTPGRVDRQVSITEEAPLAPENRLVVQVSRWDRLKDPLGVMEGFARCSPRHPDAHLVLAGPATEGVSDDPEGALVLSETEQRWASLPDDVRARVHLVSIPMADAEENAAIVNALQLLATVVVQKSLAEGFGLTVAEAMWKGRPVVASRVGGIQDQISDGLTGLLVDPLDLDSFAAQVSRLLDDPAEASRLGTEARRRVRDAFLGPRHLGQYVALFSRLIQGDDASAWPAFPTGELG